jgi:predicted nucleotidyltransferase
MELLRPRDFIDTIDGLLFAALGDDVAFLRYFSHPKGERNRGNIRYRKVGSTQSSFDFLEKNFPAHVVERNGRRLQHCPLETIQRVYSPIKKLEELKSSKENLATKCLKLSAIFEEIPEDNKGITGSILVGLHTPSSDIDFVVYGSKYFDTASDILRESSQIKPLNEKQWRRYYEKRFPNQRILGFEEFLWHEKRKSNIGIIDETIFNLLLVGNRAKLEDSTPVRPIRIKCDVTDATQSFDIPSVYRVDHELVDEVLSFTHTYAGQARKGETVEVFGMLEKKQKGYRIVVGTTREAEGEYIKVIEP